MEEVEETLTSRHGMRFRICKNKVSRTHTHSQLESPPLRQQFFPQNWFLLVDKKGKKIVSQLTHYDSSVGRKAVEEVEFAVN